MAIALVLLLLAIGTLMLALRIRQTTGIPWKRIVASDTSGEKPLDHPIFSSRYALTGMPDYVLKVGRGYVPVEVKPSRYVKEPYESDLMQVVAYCFLIEETTGYVPPYGILRYAKQSFQVAYTAAIREQLLDVLDDMQDALTMDNCTRNHNNPRRCQGCGFVHICEDSLG